MKGKGLEKLITEENYEAMGITLESSISDQPAKEITPAMDTPKVLSKFTEPTWY